MPKLVTPLTEAKVKNAKPKDKPYKLADDGGLYLEVMPTGSKLWRMKFIQANGKENRLAFGSCTEVTIANARAEREKARTLQKEGTDPAQARRIEQHKRAIASANTFEAVAREWYGNKSETWSKDTADNAIHRLEKDIFPLVGKTPISEVDAPMMLDALRQVERRGAVEIASRLAQHCGQIFRFAVASGIIKYNPLPDLREALKKRAKGHHAAIGVAELPDFLRALQKNEADMHYATRILMRILMRIMMLVFVRTSELIETPWSEVDLENEIWIIPWQRMKMGRKTLKWLPHAIPDLSLCLHWLRLAQPDWMPPTRGSRQATRRSDLRHIAQYLGLDPQCRRRAPTVSEILVHPPTCEVLWI